MKNRELNTTRRNLMKLLPTFAMSPLLISNDANTSTINETNALEESIKDQRKCIQALIREQSLVADIILDAKRNKKKDHLCIKYYEDLGKAIKELLSK